MKITDLKVNTDRMSENVRTEQELLTRARNHAKQIKENMDLLRSAHQGAAGTAVQQQAQAIFQNMNSLCDMFERLINILDDRRAEYVACEAEVQQIVNQLRV